MSSSPIVFRLVILAFCLSPLRAGAAVAPSARYLSAAINGGHAADLTLKVTGEKLTGEYLIRQAGPYFLRTHSVEGTLSGETLSLEELKDDGSTDSSTTTALFKGRVLRQRPLKVQGLWFGIGHSPLSALLQEHGSPYTGFRIVWRHYSERRGGYTISAGFPQLYRNGSDTAAVNREIDRAVLGVIHSFKTQWAKDSEPLAADRRSPSTAKLAGMPPWEEDVTAQVLLANGQLVSVRLTDYEYTGGAHGITVEIPINFDLRSGKRLRLADLFRPRSGYLQVIARDCAKVLRVAHPELYVDPMWLSTLRENTGPVDRNYQTWNITPGGLSIVFGQYQVGPYAYGESEVIIPWAGLQTLLARPYRFLARGV